MNEINELTAQIAVKSASQKGRVEDDIWKNSALRKNYLIFTRLVFRGNCTNIKKILLIIYNAFLSSV